MLLFTNILLLLSIFFVFILFILMFLGSIINAKRCVDYLVDNEGISELIAVIEYSIFVTLSNGWILFILHILIRNYHSILSYFN